MMDFAQWTEIIGMLVALLLSLSVHEAAHAFAAKHEGDDTAQRMGRLTLNPLAHIDLVGTIIVPLALKLMGSIMFGWAKPVPVDVSQLRNHKWSYLIVALAGPASNLILCFITLLILTFYQQSTGGVMLKGDIVIAVLLPTAIINAYLAVFNLLPIAPLDGSALISVILPNHLQRLYYSYLAPYGLLILIALMYAGATKWIGFLAFAYISAVQTILSFVI